MDPEGSRFISEHQVQVQHDGDWKDKLNLLQNYKQMPPTPNATNEPQSTTEPPQTEAYEDRIDFYSHRIDDNHGYKNEHEGYDSEGCEFEDFEDQTLQNIQNKGVFDKNIEAQPAKSALTSQSKAPTREMKPKDLSSKLDKQLTNQIVEEANFEEEEDSFSADLVGQSYLGL